MPSSYVIQILGNDDECNAPQSRGRMVHAMKTAEALKEGGADVKIYFDAMGVNWLKRFDLNDSKFTQNYMETFNAIKPLVAGACNFCATKRFDYGGHAEKLGIGLHGGDGQHGTVADLLLGGAQLLTF